MPFDQTELIAPATGAVTSSPFIVGKGAGSGSESNPTTVIASNLAGAETAAIEIKTLDASFPWIALLEGGNAVELTATNNVEVLAAPGVFRIVKGVTAGACGIYISTPKAPGVLA